MNEKDVLDELERVCRIIAYSKVDDGKDLEFCRRAITQTLEQLAKVRGLKAAKLAARGKDKRGETR